MTCKKYRACLVGLIVVTLVCGIFFYMKHEKENRIPTGGTLVKEMENREDGTDALA